MKPTRLPERLAAYTCLLGGRRFSNRLARCYRRLRRHSPPVARLLMKVPRVHRWKHFLPISDGIPTRHRGVTEKRCRPTPGLYRIFSSRWKHSTGASSYQRDGAAVLHHPTSHGVASGAQAAKCAAPRRAGHADRWMVAIARVRDQSSSRVHVAWQVTSGSSLASWGCRDASALR
jgi:hypothetical protein